MFSKYLANLDVKVCSSVVSVSYHSVLSNLIHNICMLAWYSKWLLPHLLHHILYLLVGCQSSVSWLLFPWCWWWSRFLRLPAVPAASLSKSSESLLLLLELLLLSESSFWWWRHCCTLVRRSAGMLRSGASSRSWETWSIGRFLRTFMMFASFSCRLPSAFWLLWIGG